MGGYKTKREADKVFVGAGKKKKGDDVDTGSLVDSPTGAGARPGPVM